MLDARIALALNTIIQNSYFKKKVSLEEQKAQKDDWFFRERPTAYMIDDYFRVTGAHDTVLDYADLFTIALRSDDVEEFDTRWDEILLSMNCTPKSKSNTLTPKTNSQTYSQRAISHVMSGTIFSIISILAFSAQQAAPKRCRKECNTEQKKRELWQSRSRR